MISSGGNETRRAWARWLAIAFLLLPRGAAADPLPSPSEEGSHELHVRALYRAAEGAYAEAAAVFDAHVAEHPTDATAALERCFFYAEALDRHDEGPWSWQDADRCEEELEAAFPEDPRVQLYVLRRSWGAEAIARGEAINKEAAERWAPKHRAELLAWLAQRVQDDDPKRASDLALHAESLNPELDLELVRANWLITDGKPEQAAEALTFTRLSPSSWWDHHQKASLLLELDHAAEALDAFALLDANGQPPPSTGDEEPEPFRVSDLNWGRALEAAGRVSEARARYDAIDTQTWNREEVDRRLFGLALAGDDPALAFDSYQRLRDHGWESDPLARKRIALAMAHGGTPRLRDLWGFAGLAGGLLALLLLPLLVLLPVHYIGLWRATRQTIDLSAPARWHVGHLWVLGVLLLLPELGAYYVFAYDQAAAWYSDEAVLALDDPAVLTASLVALLAMALVLPLLRRADLRPWLLGETPPRKLIGPVIGSFFLILVVRAWLAPLGQSCADLVDLETVGVFAAPVLGELIRGLLDQFGLGWVLLATVVIAPIAEEIAFRGIGYDALSRYLPSGIAAAAQAGAFAVLHADAEVWPAHFVFGLLALHLRKKHGGLLAPIAFHALNNLMAVGVVAAMA